jgi:hypothetical protein
MASRVTREWFASGLAEDIEARIGKMPEDT